LITETPAVCDTCSLHSQT